MATYCAPACKSCDQLDINLRCPWDPKDFPDAWLAPNATISELGSDAKTADDDTDTEETDNEIKSAAAGHNKTLNFMFERLVTDPWFQEKYQPTILSRDPWAVTLENFITDEECEEFIRMGTDGGYERSEDVGEETFDGTPTSITSSSRTSHNAWCGAENGCQESETNKRVLERIENITGIPSTNYEHLQLLKYEVGEYYKQHQ